VFPKAKRDYNAATAFLVKNFSQSWLGQVSYTLGSLRGNYAGLYAPEDGYLGPNGTADFDSVNVPINRDGALKGDVRHTVKVLASKEWSITRLQNIGTGVFSRPARARRPATSAATSTRIRPRPT
jgi:hypothetical protein